VPFKGLSAPGHRPLLRVLRIVARGAVSPQLSADRAVMATEYFGNLSLAFAGHTQGRNLISLCLELETALTHSGQ